MVALVAILRAKAGLAGPLKERLMSLVEPTLAEPGCVQYDLHQGTEDPNTFVFYERWKTAEDLAEHAGRPHMLAFGSVAKGLVATRELIHLTAA
ncbi:MAG: putative quinol monooxygenase [Gemmatimonadota bacterium]